MTVKELVELLGKYPEDLRIVVNGYEDGYDDLSLERISIINRTYAKSIDIRIKKQ